MLLQIKTSKVCARTEGRRAGYKDLYIFEREAGGYTFFMACVTIRTNFLKCFGVRAVGNALQLQISVIDVVSNLIESGNKAASSVDNPNIFRKQNFKSGEVLPFLDILQRQNVYKMVVLGNEVLINQIGDWSARMLWKLARVNDVNTIMYSLDPT